MIKSNSIPLSKCRLEIIDNRDKKLDMRVLWQKHGGSNKILMNGPFFSFQTYLPTVHMKIHGNVINQPNYGEWGIAWNDGGAPVWTKLPAPQYQNYFTNTVVIPDGNIRKELSSHPDADGTKAKPRFTSRPAFGFKGDNFMTYMGTSGLSLWGLQKLLYNSGWKYALVGDGGGSTAYKDAKTEHYTSRVIPYWILITIEDDGAKETPVISKDVCPYKEPTTLLRQGSRGDGVKWMQWYLRRLVTGALAVDGIFGKASKVALEQFQRAHKLDVDGVLGPASRAALKKAYQEQ